MPATIGSGTIGSTAIGGNPAAGQRGKFLQLPRARIRIIDPVTGSVLIDRLPHIAWEFENIFPQLGMAGSSAIGHVIIHLYHPLTDEYAWAKAWYDKLGPAQRVEIYMTEDPDGYGAVGDPEFTGVITNLPKEDFSFRIEGEDSLKLLEWSRTLQSDTFTGSTSDLLKYALKTYQMTMGDDWTGDLTAYTNNGSWALTTDQGFPAVKTGLAGDGLLYTTASYASSKYADCFIEAPFHITCGSQAGNVAEAGVIAAVADSNNFILGRAYMRQVTATQYYIDAEITQKIGGVYTRKVITQNVISEPGPTAQVTVTLVGVQTTATTYTWRLLLNEIDSNCAVTYLSGTTSGGVGLRSSATGSTAFVQHHLVFMSKANAFQPGNIAPGTQRFASTPIASQANIDLLQLAASTEGNVWRKRPKPGLNNDVIDFGVSVGNDLSGIVRFEENIHIVASQSEPNAEPLNTAVLAAGHPNYNNRGHHRWYDVPTSKSRGVIITPLVLPQVADHFSLRQMAQNALLKRKQPTQAQRMTVLRHEDHAQLPSQPTPTGMAYRDGDWVTQHEPRKGLNYKRVQIMSAKVVSGIPTMELTLDQYPVYTDRMPLVDRLNSVVTAAHLGRGDATQRDSNGLLHDTRTVLPIMPWKMRVYLNSVQNAAKNSDVKVLYDTIDRNSDTANGFSAANSNYVVVQSGFYVMDAVVNFIQPLEANQLQWWYAALYVNGIIAKQGQVSEFAQNAGAISVTTCAAQVTENNYYLNLGDIVDVRFHMFCGAATIALNTGSAFTTWSMQLVSG